MHSRRGYLWVAAGRANAYPGTLYVHMHDGMALLQLDVICICIRIICMYGNVNTF